MALAGPGRATWDAYVAPAADASETGPPGASAADVSACDRARTLARLPGYAAAARGGSPRARRVRPDAVGQVGGDRDPEHPRMGRAGDRRIDQARPPRRDAHRPARSAARCSCSTRSVSGRRRATRGRRSPAASSWNGALQTAQRMASAGETDTSTVKGGSFWSQAAEQRLAPLLYAAARTAPRDGRGRALGLRPGRRRA